MVFIVLIRKWECLRNGGNFKCWLSQITRRMSVDQRRRLSSRSCGLATTRLLRRRTMVRSWSRRRIRAPSSRSNSSMRWTDCQKDEQNRVRSVQADVSVGETAELTGSSRPQGATLPGPRAIRCGPRELDVDRSLRYPIWIRQLNQRPRLESQIAFAESDVRPGMRWSPFRIVLAEVSTKRPETLKIDFWPTLRPTC